MKLPNIFEKDAQSVTIPAGEQVFEAGQPADCMYIVQHGEADIVIGDRVVETVGPDGFFGEMAMIDSQPRSATVVAKTDCTVLAIDQKRFLFMVQETPFFALEVMRMLVARLRRQGARL